MGRAPCKSAKEDGVGTLSSVSAFNHERALMSCLLRIIDHKAKKLHLTTNTRDSQLDHSGSKL